MRAKRQGFFIFEPTKLIGTKTVTDKNLLSPQLTEQSPLLLRFALGGRLPCFTSSSNCDFLRKI